MNQFFILLFIVPLVHGHSWVTCPPSFVTTNGRGGTQDKPCETSGSGAITTEVWAGDRLKVGWTSNNHAGGYVRLSLVKYGDHWGSSNDVIESNFKSNVLKYACYGHDARLGANNGDCNHPCNGREGCSYQSNEGDKERYDTTIGIPTNLNGIYVLQAALLVGNSETPYYSCAKLNIVNGNPGLSCQSNQEPLTYSCVRTAGPVLSTNFLRVGAQPGAFCYHFDGRIGTTDDTIRNVPINVECDPRMTCDNAIHKNLCLTDAPTMSDLIRGNGQAKLPNCRVWNVVPPPKPTCSDGVRNGDEEGIDCGGLYCTACPPIVPPGEYHGEITQTTSLWGGGGNFQITVEITKTITETQCWQLILQYNHPVSIDSTWGAGRKVAENDQKTIITIEKPNIWTVNPKQGDVLKIFFSATNPLYSLAESDPTRVVWNSKSIEPQGATTLFVSDQLSDCVGL